MKTEYVWFMPFILAALSMAGGTWNKLIRRLGCPMVLGVTAALFLGWFFNAVVLACLYFAVYSLPFTLIGDDVRDHWFNWVWIWLAGFALGLPILYVGMKEGEIILCIFLSFIPAIVQGIFGTLSNLKFTRNIFPWKLVEGLIGLSVGLPFAYFVQLTHNT